MTVGDRTGHIARGLIDHSLPKAQWTHAAHLRAGLWHVLRHEPDEALALLRERIRAYNVAIGGTNTESEGYHETITRLYVHLIAGFVRDCDRARAQDDLAEDLIAQWSDRNVPARFYSHELLHSTRARLNWVEPDRESLP